MPLLNLFPSSVTDVITLHNLDGGGARSIGIARLHVILDRGFYGEWNIELHK